MSRITEELAQYIPPQHREKFLKEVEAYERLWPKLRETHLGKWVAVHNGEVVAFDDDRRELTKWVRAKYGNTPILITQVLERVRRIVDIPGIDS